MSEKEILNVSLDLFNEKVLVTIGKKDGFTSTVTLAPAKARQVAEALRANAEVVDRADKRWAKAEALRMKHEVEEDISNEQ